MRLRLALARAPLLLLLAGLLVALVSRSTLVEFLPQPLPAAWPLWAFGGACLLLVPALVTRGPAAPSALAATVPAIAIASYGAGRLDWLRVLKDFGVQESDPVNVGRLALVLAALVVAYLLHAVDVACRLRWRSLARGVPAEHARAAFWTSLGRNAAALVVALLGTLALLAVGAAAAGAAWPGAGRVALVAPVAAALLVAAAALLLGSGRARDAGRRQ